MIAKLCIRPNDTSKGRQLKLNHYIHLHRKYFGIIPDDIHKFVRVEKDIPIIYKRDIMEILKEKGWKPRKIPQEPSLMQMDGDEMSERIIPWQPTVIAGPKQAIYLILKQRK